MEDSAWQLHMRLRYETEIYEGSLFASNQNERRILLSSNNTIFL